MDRIVAGEHLDIADCLRTPAPVGDKAARLAHQQTARGGIPRLETAFPEALIAPGRDPGEIERGGAKAADASNLRRQCVVDRGPFGGIARSGKGNAGGDQALVEVPPARNPQPPVLLPGAAIFSAQKLSSVIG